MKKELWLEFGYKQQNNYEDMVWYNEGRWQEIFYFLKKLFRYRKEQSMYFLWRCGKKKHYLKK